MMVAVVHVVQEESREEEMVERVKKQGIRDTFLFVVFRSGISLRNP
jgi:hypothetical protein